MGLPDNLTSTYAQYKADTDYIATWLAVTSRRCGYQPDETPSIAAEKSSGKAKGSKRRSKKGAGASQAGGNAQPSGAYKIKIRDYVPMAEKIASTTKPPVVVPDSFIALLKRSIALRNSIGATYEDDALDSGSNDGHKHFIGVLEQVRAILQAKLAPRRRKTDEPSLSPPTPLPVQNSIYESLCQLSDHEDDKEEVEYLETFSLAPNKAKKTATKYEVETIDDLQEHVLVFHCFLKDLAEMRELVKETWLGFLKGDHDLVTAALVSDTCIDLARHMESEAMGHSSTIRHPKDLLDLVVRGQQATKRHRRRDRRSQRDRNAEAHIGQLWAVSKLMEDYLGRVKPNALLCVSADPKPFSEIVNVCAPAITIEDLTRDQALLLRLFNHLHLNRIAELEYDYDDQLVRGYRNMISFNSISMWMVFATQVVLDINNAMKNDTNLGFRDLWALGELHKRSAKDNVAVLTSMAYNKLPNELYDAHFFIDKVLQKEHLEEVYAGWPKLKPFYVDAYDLLKIHPTRCGLIAHQAKVRLQKLGIHFANEWNMIINAAHLHNCLRQEKLLSGDWFDMRLMMTLQNPHHLFAAAYPTTAEMYSRRYQIAVLGMSIANYAPNQHYYRPKYASAGPRQLQELAPVSRLLLQRYNKGQDPKAMNAADIESIVDVSTWSQTEVTGDNESLETILKRMSLEEINTRNKETKAKHNRKIPVHKLLRALRSALDTEVSELAFDYFTMTINCYLVLNKIDQGTAIYEGDTSDKPICYEYATVVVGWIFQWLVLARSFPESPQARKDVLSIAAKVVQDMSSTDKFSQVYRMARASGGMTTVLTENGDLKKDTREARKKEYKVSEEEAKRTEQLQSGNKIEAIDVEEV